MGFRDNTVIIIETSRTAVRAALGLFEPLKTPSVVLPPPPNILALARSKLFVLGHCRSCGTSPL